MSPRANDEQPPEAELPEDAAQLVATGRRRSAIMAGIVAAEGVALAVFAVYLVVNLIAGSEETTTTSNTIIETVMFFVLAALLVLLARGVVHCRRWSRAPVVVTQLITVLGPGLNILQGDLWYRWVLGVPLTGLAAVALVLALTPAVTAATEAAEEE